LSDGSPGPTAELGGSTAVAEAGKEREGLTLQPSRAFSDSKHLQLHAQSPSSSSSS